MRERIKREIIWSVSITSLLVICIAFAFFGQSGDDAIDRVVGVVAIISGVGSVIMGVSSIFSTSLDNVREYYATGDSEKMRDARKVLYNYRYIKIKHGKTIADEDFDEWVKQNIDPKNGILKLTTKDDIINASSTTTDFFQMWGLLQYKNFLPMWVFETASGYSIIKLYEAVDDIVAENRENNPFYALQFRDLCARITSKYKKAIAECRKNETEYIKKNLDMKDLTNNEYFDIELK